MYVRIKTYSYFYPNSIDVFFQGFNSQKGSIGSYDGAGQATRNSLR